jgi:hypothetical protein
MGMSISERTDVVEVKRDESAKGAKHEDTNRPVGSLGHGVDHDVRCGAEAECTVWKCQCGIREAEDAGRRMGSRLQHGKIQARYELVSDGHVLVEHLTIAGVHDNMVTTYYLDGDKLGLTHYCAAGNQPRMESKGINADGTIRFDFAGAANLASPRDKHMHSVLVHLIDNDHFTSDWTLFDGGKAKMTVAPQYARVK